MTVLAAFVILSGAVGEYQIPLEDPLVGWLLYLEPAGVLSQGGVLPDGFLKDQPDDNRHHDRYWWSGMDRAVDICLSSGALSGSRWNRGWSPVLSRLSQAVAPATRTLCRYGSRGFICIGGRALIEGAAGDPGEEFRAGTSLDIQGEVANISFVERLSVWAGSDEAPPDGFAPWHQGEEEGRHLYVDRGYATAGLVQGPFWLTMDFGRIPQRWGPGRFTSLLISDNSPALDMLRVKLDFGSVDFIGFTSVVESDSSTWLTAHRLDMRPWNWLRLGLSEAVLFQSDGPDFAYMNPIIPWYPVQWNEREDDNAMLAFDATVIPATGFCGWAELLVDDFQYQSEYGRPNKTGYTLGVSAAFPDHPAGFTLEYTRIDRYVYSQKLERNYYLHDGRIIGSELGPDADRLRLEIAASPGWNLLARLGAEHERQGEGTVEEGWPDTFPEETSFPSGTVEHITRARAGLSARVLPWLDLGGAGVMVWTRNRGHLAGDSDESLEGTLSLTARW
ncbi:capsule assembly Wzi family protein [Candidatus Fermentibacteria bacterium]|nr:capsule assembly Wzi family protein [Candidatus Fermentibacteria bacterium]